MCRTTMEATTFRKKAHVKYKTGDNPIGMLV